MRNDNATPHAASEYEQEVRRTIPFHAELVQTAVDAALAFVSAPRNWLDTGCGPGALTAIARARAPETAHYLADPSPAMLALSQARHPDLAEDRFFPVASAELPESGPFDVVTAVQCHHYGDAAERERSVARCRDLLAPGGVLVVFENVRAETEAGHAAQRRRWAAWQLAQGRDLAIVQEHLGREGTKFFPIRVSDHVELFQRLGFGAVELVWRAYGQAGFTAVR